MPFKVTVPSKVIPFIIHVEPAVNRVHPWRSNAVKLSEICYDPFLEKGS